MLCHVLLLMAEALAPENRHGNGLSPAALAAVLAEVGVKTCISQEPGPTCLGVWQVDTRGRNGNVRIGGGMTM